MKTEVTMRRGVGQLKTDKERTVLKDQALKN